MRSDLHAVGNPQADRQEAAEVPVAASTFIRRFEDHWPYQEYQPVDFRMAGTSIRTARSQRDIAQVERRRILFAPIATPSLAGVTHSQLGGSGGFGGRVELLFNSRTGGLSFGTYRRVPYGHHG